MQRGRTRDGHDAVGHAATNPTRQVYGFLTTAPNAIVAPIHPNASQNVLCRLVG
jgi:hypothetical protein